MHLQLYENIFRRLQIYLLLIFTLLLIPLLLKYIAASTAVPFANLAPTIESVSTTQSSSYLHDFTTTKQHYALAAITEMSLSDIIGTPISRNELTRMLANLPKVLNSMQKFGVEWESVRYSNLYGIGRSCMKHQFLPELRLRTDSVPDTAC
jgi:hypothetical protein